MERGAYIVQPVAAAPPGANNEATSNRAAKGSSQKLKLFRRGKAISEAPSISGNCQLAKPTKAGITAPKTMIRPCSVVSSLKNSGRSSCMPGRKSSARSVRAITPPTRNIATLNHRYRVPMSLWFVVRNQRISPVGSAGRTVPGTLSSTTCIRFSTKRALCDENAPVQLVRADGGCGRLGLMVDYPLLVVRLGDSLDHDRHETVLLAAQFGTGSAVGARRLDFEPRIAHQAGDRVLLDPEGR